MITKQQEQAIRETAYFKWEQAGHPFGDDLKFWFIAEQEQLTNPYRAPAFYSDVVEEALQETFPISESGTWLMTNVGLCPK